MGRGDDSHTRLLEKVGEEAGSVLPEGRGLVQKGRGRGSLPSALHDMYHTSPSSPALRAAQNVPHCTLLLPLPPPSAGLGMSICDWIRWWARRSKLMRWAERELTVVLQPLMATPEGCV